MTLTAMARKSIGPRRYRRLSKELKNLFRQIDEANRLMRAPAERPRRRS